MTFFKDWFKKKKSKEQICLELKPGDSYCYTSGVCGSIYYHGKACDICGKAFIYSSWTNPPFFSPDGPYWYVDFGKYKPQRIWFCLAHTNKEIEAKMEEMDK